MAAAAERTPGTAVHARTADQLTEEQIAVLTPLSGSRGPSLPGLLDKVSAANPGVGQHYGRAKGLWFYNRPGRPRAGGLGVAGEFVQMMTAK
ncbi:hypothetical protein JZ751_022177 [Albula glossodonta]|uniref:Uncharacterized protein n=1 Tax=Albula glossodonta TaxID=121402 RepID=A0A8T2MXH2_9TELE|nr:hypothetical protein JZ751_022177 [Albula glossodonta]